MIRVDIPNIWRKFNEMQNGRDKKAGFLGEKSVFFIVLRGCSHYESVNKIS